MENEKKTLSGSELLAVMDLASQKRLATAMNSLKAEGLIFYAFAFVIGFLVCLWLEEESYGWLIILYGISALGAGYAVRNVRKTWSARTLCFLLTVFILFLSLWLSMMIFSHMISPYRYSETSLRYLYPDLYAANFPGMVKDFFVLLRELGNRLFFIAAFILGSFALKATANDLFWDNEKTVESIRIKDGRTLIKEPQAESKFSNMWNRLCVVLGWIFLSMNLLAAIYRCMGPRFR